MPPSNRSSLLVVGTIVGLVLIGGAMAELGGVTDSIDSDSTVLGAGFGETEDGSVTIVEVSETEQVRVDSPIQISATVSNTYETEKERPAALKMDVTGNGELATVVSKQNVTAPAGASTGITFTVPSGTLTPGTYEYGVVVGNVSATPTQTRNVTALQPPTFAVTETTSSRAVLRGNNATAVATIRNDGDYAGVKKAHLIIADSDDGTTQPEKVVVEKNIRLGAGESKHIEITFPTEQIEPGTQDYRVSIADSSATGTVTVKRPATFQVSQIDARNNVTRGETVTVSTTVTNTGDVTGTEMVRYEGINGTVNVTRNATLAAGESTTVNTTVDTANLPRGNYTVNLSTPDDNESVRFRVQDGTFEVTRVRGAETLDIGEKLLFEATVVNTGDVNDTQTLAYKIDLDDDDRPESHGVAKQLTLAPGEQTDVTFTIPYRESSSSLNTIESSPGDTYIYGVYSEDTNTTDVFATKAETGSARDGSDNAGSDESGSRVTLDEISQQKYGYYYDDISGETRAQIEEIYQRQPFADGLVVTQVLTREEIARQQYGLNVGHGDEFEFHEIDVETQQQIEADFDAQFQSDTGDRIESWDELARSHYGCEYEECNSSQRQTVRDTYSDQF